MLHLASRLFLPLRYVAVELLSVLFQRQFLVLVQLNRYFPLTNNLLFLLMKLSHVWVLERLFSSQTLLRVELKKLFKQVDS